ncbi:erythromycin esterase family protein [Nonomuraea sp. NPDC049419]|uniref:erythromycin esterase family protein n=1 Tax=Nonomuraea sp. NPDC049419 TaxID=3155772 RepID=UPI003434728F
MIPLRTLDPRAPLDDLTWVNDAIGDARVIAVGESSHYTREFAQLRHRLVRCLVERHGFTAYAMETGFTESRRADAWVRGAEDRPAEVMAYGLTSLMGLWRETRAHLEWLRRHNATAARPAGFYGIDLGGHNASLLPALDAVLAYLALADPGFRPDPALRETAAGCAATSAFSAPAAMAAYARLAPERKDALTAGLAALASRVGSRRLEHVRRTTAEAYACARRSVHHLLALDQVFRGMTVGDQQSVVDVRDAAIAGTVEWILRREDRIVLAAHNSHVQRGPVVLPGMEPATPLGLHLADRLGAGYLVIGTTSGTGQTLNPDGAAFLAGDLFAPLEAPEPGSLDAVMHAAHDGPHVIDLRRLPPTDAVLAARTQRMGTAYVPVNPLTAYDLLVHLPQATAATLDGEAVACSPREVRDAVSPR